MSAVLLVADSDSQMLYCEALARGHRAAGLELTIHLIPRDGTPEAVKGRMEQLGTVQQGSLGTLLQDPGLSRFAAIGVFLTGSKIAGFRSAYLRSRQHDPQRRALLFCGFNGVVLERFEEALTWRLGYDLICLNGPRDQARFERFLRHTPFRAQRAVLTGLRRTRVAEVRPLAERPRQLVFAEQVAMPASLEERRQLARLVVDLAHRFSDWQVVLKPRVAPHEATFHEFCEHITTTLEQVCRRRPANLAISYAPLAALLADSRLFATLSSTALFDALDHGCSALVMGDFGLRPDLGSDFFGGSGLVRNLAGIDDLDALVGLQGNPAWLHWVGYDGACNPSQLFDAIKRHGLQQDGAPAQDPLELEHRGYVVNSADLSSNQLRLAAEAAIAAHDYAEAGQLLEMAALQRPHNGNIQRRLKAVRCPSHLGRRLLLLASPRFNL